MTRFALIALLLLAVGCEAEIEHADEPALNHIAEKNRAAAREGAERMKAESKAASAYPGKAAEPEE